MEPTGPKGPNPDDPNASIIPLPSQLPSQGAGEFATSMLLRQMGVPSVTPEAAAEPYRLVRILGQGGMGEVWVARQNSLGRLVAVKRVRGTVVKDRDSLTEVLRRQEFRQEAIISAQLSHPGIAPVYDLGVDDNGDPLMVMKLIDGRSWEMVLAEDFTDLSPADLLAKHVPVLVDVVQAVAFAHSRGVIHRDLKPSQVVLGEYGEVTLMDWGLAVYILDQPLSSEPDPALQQIPTLASATNPAGTPAYMAPEQAQVETAGLGPWTDVYLVGSLLYHLLTGSPPHRAPTAKEAMQKAREGKVQPPRERAPDRSIPPELEKLCMHCLQPERAQRPGSAKEVLAALQDYLSGTTRRREAAELVHQGEELSRKGGSGYDHLTEALSLAGRALALWPDTPGLVELGQKARELLAASALEAGDLRLARTQLDAMCTGEARARLQGRLDAAERRLRRQALTRQAAVLACAVLAIAIAVVTHRYSTRLEGQVAQTRAALARAQAARNDAEGLTSFMLGDLREKLEPIGSVAALQGAAARVLDYFAHLPADERDRPATLLARSTALRQTGIADRDMGRIPDSVAHLEQALALARRAVAAGETTETLWALASAQCELGHGYRFLGREKDALASYAAYGEGATRLTGLDPSNDRWQCELGDSLASRGQVHQAAGRWDEAIDLYRQQVALMKTLSDRHPLQAPYAPSYIDGLRILAQCYQEKPGARVDLALQADEISSPLADRYMAAHPGDTDAIRRAAQGHNDKSIHLQNAMRHEESIVEITRAIEIYQALVDRDPLNAAWQTDLAGLLINRGATLARAGRPREGLPDLQKGITLFTRRLAADPGNMETLYNLQTALGPVTDCQTAVGDVPGMRASAQQALSILETTLQRGVVKDPVRLSSWVIPASRLAAYLDRTHDLLGAEDCFAGVVAALDGVLEKFPKSQTAKIRRYEEFCKLARVRSELGDAEASESMVTETIATMQAMTPTSPAAIALRNNVLAAALGSKAGYELGCGNPAEAVAAADAAQATMAQGLLALPPSADNPTYFGNAAVVRGRVFKSLGMRTAALEAWREGRDVLRPYVEHMSEVQRLWEPYLRCVQEIAGVVDASEREQEIREALALADAAGPGGTDTVRDLVAELKAILGARAAGTTGK